jgi:hypothetical protein
MTILNKSSKYNAGTGSKKDNQNINLLDKLSSLFLLFPNKNFLFKFLYQIQKRKKLVL